MIDYPIDVDRELGVTAAIKYLKMKADKQSQKVKQGTRDYKALVIAVTAYAVGFLTGAYMIAREIVPC